MEIDGKRRDGEKLEWDVTLYSEELWALPGSKCLLYLPAADALPCSSVEMTWRTTG